MKNLIIFISFIGFLFSNEILNFMEVEQDNSFFYLSSDRIIFRNQFKNVSDKKIKDFKYEINIYNKNDSLIKNVTFSYIKEFYPNRTIEPGESYKDRKRFKFIDIFGNYKWSSSQNTKVKVRVIEVTLLDNTIKNNNMELVSIQGDIRYLYGYPKKVNNPITFWFFNTISFMVGMFVVGLLGLSPYP